MLLQTFLAAAKGVFSALGGVAITATIIGSSLMRASQDDALSIKGLRRMKYTLGILGQGVVRSMVVGFVLFCLCFCISAYDQAGEALGAVAKKDQELKIALEKLRLLDRGGVFKKDDFSVSVSTGEIKDSPDASLTLLISNNTPNKTLTHFSVSVAAKGCDIRAMDPFEGVWQKSSDSTYSAVDANRITPGGAMEWRGRYGLRALCAGGISISSVPIQVSIATDFAQPLTYNLRARRKKAP